MSEELLGGRLVLRRGYLPQELRRPCFDRLLAETRWLAPRPHWPRQTANYGEKSYDYSGMEFRPEPWTDLLRELKELVEAASGVKFNALILQHYRDGFDGVNWHADDSPAVGPNPTIASLSLGATRTFALKSKDFPADRLLLDLEDGDLLIMRGDLQHSYLHKVPKQLGAGPRINLTFRRVL